MLLTGCATVPNVLVKAVCPRVPALDQLPVALEPNFTDRMQAFLSGNLPEQTNFSLNSGNAKPNTTKSGTP